MLVLWGATMTDRNDEKGGADSKAARFAEKAQESDS